MKKNVFVILFITVTFLIFNDFSLAQSLPEPAPKNKKKDYDRGNCFHWKNCEGESIGNMWMHDPYFCKTYGGKSFMDQNGTCFNLPDGPRGM